MDTAMVIFTVTINFEQVKINSSITTIERLFFFSILKNKLQIIC